MDTNKTKEQQIQEVINEAIVEVDIERNEVEQKVEEDLDVAKKESEEVEDELFSDDEDIINLNNQFVKDFMNAKLAA